MFLKLCLNLFFTDFVRCGMVLLHVHTCYRGNITGLNAKLIKTKIMVYIFVNYLKPLYTFGKQNCPSPTLRVSQLAFKITKPVKI